MLEEPELLTASNFVQVTAKQAWSNLPLVVAGGLVFAAACTPAAALGLLGIFSLMLVAVVFLVSPAWTALLALLVDVVSERRASPAGMLRSFIRLWHPSVRLSLLFVIPLFAAWLTLPWFRLDQVSPVMWFALFVEILGLAVAWSIGLYAYPWVVVYEASVQDAVRNGAILASRHALHTVGMVSMAVLCMVATGVIGIALMLFLPALYGMFVVNNFHLTMSLELEP